MHTAAVVVAAGKGKRFGTGYPKQFADLCGKPVLWRTLAVFERCARVDDIVVVLPPDDFKQHATLVRSWQFARISRYVKGGAARHFSVWNGLLSVAPETEIILVHDGVRPFVTEQLIDAVIDGAVRYGACIPGVMPKDTIKSVNGHFVRNTPDRKSLILTQTPQGFQKDILISAYEKAEEQGRFSTDDASLVEHSGNDVFVVSGDYGNIKITSPEDLLLAATLLKPKSL
ncbi:2-C-methyl-D-erythritol 4-phosphate cytidylyltransferase [candidate division KSB1 bacterium RBG_16_48_16]|nr:MAG: 2-C-methyl-D-erythritol 4-phosphate cytidylyltransferase [candidate division KSB1 bacterium RBG_16_48_16]